MKNKKAAFEMSMTTVVVIVIAVIMLVLGIVFVTQIFETATGSVSIIDEQVKNRLKTMFGEEQGHVVVYTPETKIKPGTESFRIPLAAKTQSGKTISQDNLQYKVSVVSDENCGGNAESWFIYPRPNTWNDFDSFEFDKGFVDLTLTVPPGTPLCTAIMKMSIKDSTGEFASKTFTVKIVRGGLF